MDSTSHEEAAGTDVPAQSQARRERRAKGPKEPKKPKQAGANTGAGGGGDDAEGTSDTPSELAAHEDSKSGGHRKPRERRPKVAGSHKGQAPRDPVAAAGDADANTTVEPAARGNRSGRRRSHQKDAQQQQDGGASGDSQEPDSTPKPHRHRNHGDTSGGKTRGDPTPRRQGHHTGSNRKQKKDFFSEHWEDDAVQHALQTGGLVSGPIRINRKKRTEAYVAVDGLMVNVFLDGEAARNRALEGDIVAVQLSPADEWRPRVVPVSNPEAEAAVAGAFMTTDSQTGEVYDRLWRPTMPAVTSERKSAENEFAFIESLDVSNEGRERLKTGSHQPSGTVVAILRRVHRRDAVGILYPAEAHADLTSPIPASHQYVQLHPIDNRVPYITLKKSQVPADFLECPKLFANTYFGVRIVDWQAQHRFPNGQMVQQFGLVGDVDAETQVLLWENHIVDAPFSQDVLQSLADFDKGAHDVWQIPDSVLAERRDLRKYRIFTVDPTNARDLDDALHITPLGNGIYELGVHIADVSYFVRPGTAVDAEASERATSTYLVQKVIPMLPRLLCEDLCSLNPGVDRLAFSCIWQMDENGDLVEGVAPWFGRTVIRSCAKLDYGTAQRCIDDEITMAAAESGNVAPELWELARRPEAPHTMAQVMQDILYMHRIAQARRKTRFDTGALAVTRSKLYITTGATGEPTGVAIYPIRDSNRLIEEYMLLANYLVAQHLMLHVGPRAVLRKHGAPDPIVLQRVAQVALAMGYKIDLSSAGGLHASLMAIAARDPIAHITFEQLTTHSLDLAVYFAIGDSPPESWKHFALNMPYYTHFTSPIRRYADVMVHRLLQAALDGPSAVDAQPPVEKFSHQCDHCNKMKEAAKAAGDASSRMYMCLYLKDHPMTTDAVVLDVGAKSFKILIVELGLERQIFCDAIGTVGHLHEETRTLVLSPEAADISADVDAQTASDADIETKSTDFAAVEDVEAVQTRLDAIAVASKDASVSAGHFVLRTMTSLQVHLEADMSKLPIDFSVKVLDIERWLTTLATSAPAQ